MQKYKFPLGQDVHDADDILAMIKTLLTENFTMGEQVATFEKMFAEYLGVKYAVMVNSGSSANLIALSALTNYKCTSRLPFGAEVLVPALCWSTSVFPIIQSNELNPVFVDIDPKTLNIDLNDLEKKITENTKAIMLVHVLGNCADMKRLMEIIEKHNLILIEDTCESLGSKHDNKYLGTFGAIGTFSFYYSHHLTCGEGGCIITDNEEYYELAKALRAHGWSRDLKSAKEIEKENPTIDPRFTFCNLGFNVRPMEIQGAMGISQLKKLEDKNNNRKINYSKIQAKILIDSRNKYISFPEKHEETDAVWFGVTLFIDKSIDINKYKNYLTENGVDNRPIISGNMVRQPVIKDLYPNLNPLDFPGAEECHFHGLFIGLSCKIMSDELIDELVNILLGYKS